MTALAAERNTPQLADGSYGWPVKGSVKIYKGALVVANAGYAAPGTAATGLVALGRAEETVDNTAGSDGALKIAVRPGVFRFGNSASTDAIAQADVGADCYIVDDQTVAKTSATGTRSRAGKIQAVDAIGVWVAIGLQY
jgi:peptidoglycan hydrolase-like protein with peptidoglycan-binding domain